MNTILEILTKSTDYLKEKNITSPRRQAEEVISDSLNIPRLELYLQYDRPLQNQELEICRLNLSRRAKGEPPQYIRGSVDFYNTTLKITPDVLIPRQETEYLVEKIVQILENQSLENKTFWDLCCGSGCIGIAIKKQFPLLDVHLSDISSEALEVAKENALSNHCDVTFHQGDLFISGKTHFLACNPPYIATSDFASLPKEVKDFEPHHALIAGPKGTEFYEKLFQILPNHLHLNAQCWFEIGESQGEILKKIFGKNSTLEKDLYGKDRFLTFFLENE